MDGKGLGIVDEYSPMGVLMGRVATRAAGAHEVIIDLGGCASTADEMLELADALTADTLAVA